MNTNAKAEFVGLAWGFTTSRENYERFITPWRRGTPLSFNSWTRGETEDKRELLNQTKSKAKTFFLFTNKLNLHPSSFQMLKSEFLRWALPQVMDIFEKLSRLVQPDLYKEILQIMKGEIAQK